MITITAHLQLLPLATVQNQLDCRKIHTIGLAFGRSGNRVMLSGFFELITVISIQAATNI
jgi:hypothetical protein